MNYAADETRWVANAMRCNRITRNVLHRDTRGAMHRITRDAVHRVSIFFPIFVSNNHSKFYV